MIWVISAIAVLLLIALYLSATAGRLDRLHHKVETGLASLDAQLTRRSMTVIELANRAILDPATSMVLMDAAEATADAEGTPLDRSQLESDLSQVLCAAFASRDEVEAIVDEEDGERFVADLGGVVHRVEMSRRFYNDSVRACRAVRRQRLVRWFRLAGSAGLPDTMEMGLLDSSRSRRALGADPRLRSHARSSKERP